MTRKLTEKQLDLMLKLKMEYKDLHDLNPLSDVQRADLDDKENVLKNIDQNNPFHHEFVTIMLLKGFGYTYEKVEDGLLELLYGHTDDFAHLCQIGGLIDKYLKQRQHFDVVNTNVLNMEDELFKNQLKTCAENILSRVTLTKKVLDHETEKKYDDLKNAVSRQIEKCKLILKN